MLTKVGPSLKDVGAMSILRTAGLEKEFLLEQSFLLQERLNDYFLHFT
jgi:hypothetical protein